MALPVAVAVVVEVAVEVAELVADAVGDGVAAPTVEVEDGVCDGVNEDVGVGVAVALVHGVPETDESAPGVALTEATATTQLRSVTDPGGPEPPSTVERPVALPAVNALTKLVFTNELPPPPEAMNENDPHAPPAPPQ